MAVRLALLFLDLLVLQAVLAHVRRDDGPTFINPPPPDASDAIVVYLGDEFNAMWSCEYAEISLLVVGPSQPNGTVSYVRVLTNAPNRSNYSFSIGEDIVAMAYSAGYSDGNDALFFMAVEDAGGRGLLDGGPYFTSGNFSILDAALVGSGDTAPSPSSSSSSSTMTAPSSASTQVASSPSDPSSTQSVGGNGGMSMDGKAAFGIAVPSALVALGSIFLCARKLVRREPQPAPRA